MDDELAQLLGDDAELSSQPDFLDLFKLDSAPDSAKESDSKNNLNNFSRESFPAVETWEQTPDPIFQKKDFYSQILAGCGDQATKIHQLLQSYLKTQVPKDRSTIRQQLIPAWWKLLEKIVVDFPDISNFKIIALRFGYLLPQLLNAGQRKMIASIVFQDNFNEPIYYIDEWINLIASGKATPLASDEVTSEKKSTKSKNRDSLDKYKASKNTHQSILESLVSKRTKLETDLSTAVSSVCLNYTKNHLDDSPEIKPYSKSQKSAVHKSNELLKNLNSLDAEINRNLDKLNTFEKKFNQLNKEISDDDEKEPAVDKSVLQKEINNIRRIAKLCAGRQGTHFPFLLKNFTLSDLSRTGTRENVIKYMAEIENLDPNIFIRPGKVHNNRIVPHTIIIPSFGDYGICWEPFERTNRTNSRGRVAIPMFPKNIRLAVIYAMGDLRWNYAKEKAGHHWMEEGLTGNYYHAFNSIKKRGDIRLSFLEDYSKWILQESQGIQKLAREIRGIFWRRIPLPNKIKKNLRSRGFVYDELYKKDINRSLSDGY